MAMRPDHQKVKQILIDAISILCKNGLAYRSELCIEGLLGITLDNNEIFLVNIKETMRHDSQDASVTNDVIDLSEAEACLTAIEDLSVRKRKEAMNANIVDAHNVDAMLDVYLRSCSSKSVFADIGADDHCQLDLAKDLTVRERRTDDLINQLADGICAEDLSCILPKDLTQKDDSNLENDLLIVKAVDSAAMTCNQADNFVSQAVWDASMDCLNAVVALPVSIREPQKSTTVASNLVLEGERKMMCTLCGKSYKNEQGLKKHKCKQRMTPLAVIGDEMQVIHVENGGGHQPLDLTTSHLDGELDDADIIDFELQDGQAWCSAATGSDVACASVATAGIAGSGGGELTSQQCQGQGSSGSSKAFSCVCSKGFNDYSRYIDHVATCKKAKTAPYSTCDICGKFFYSNSGFVKHRRYHVGAYNFRCPVCHKGFFDRTHMRSHVDSSHSKVRRHECPSCHQGFFWKHHLKRHLNTCGQTKVTVAASASIALSSAAVTVATGGAAKS